MLRRVVTVGAGAVVRASRMSVGAAVSPSAHCASARPLHSGWRLRDSESESSGSTASTTGDGESIVQVRRAVETGPVINHPKILKHREGLPEKQSQGRIKRMRAMLRRQDARGYSKAVAFFKNHEKTGAADLPLYTLMLDHTYSMSKQRDILNSLVDSWEIDITSSGYAYAAVVNLAILHANKEATVALWNEALISNPTCPRLKKLQKRPPARVQVARAETITRAGKYGCYDDAMALFRSINEAGLDEQMHHEAALWACASYDEVSTIWANMDAARIERGWKPASIDAYNAVIWRLYLDDRPDDIHLVLNEVKRVGLTPNDRTLHGVQRMGERIAQRKRAERDSWKTWQTAFTTSPTPRLRVGM